MKKWMRYLSRVDSADKELIVGSFLYPANTIETEPNGVQCRYKLNPDDDVDAVCYA
ncbi:hypothetical protein ACE6H2_025020 [Prunus campanulata]